MKRSIKICINNIIGLILCVMTLVVLSSCSFSYTIDTLDDYAIGYSSKSAFIGYVSYDLDTVEIHLPDEYKGVKVLELGGYYGRGVPTPFFLGYEGITEGFLMDFDSIDENDTIIEVNIDVYLPKYLKKCVYVQPLVCGTSESGQNTIYLAKCNYYLDSENDYFYTKDGKLYNKSDNTIVNNLIYQN